MQAQLQLQPIYLVVRESNCLQAYAYGLPSAAPSCILTWPNLAACSTAQAVTNVSQPSPPAPELGSPCDPGVAGTLGAPRLNISWTAQYTFYTC